MIFDAKVMIFDAKVMIFDAKVMIFEAKVMIFEAKVMTVEAKVMNFRGKSDELSMHNNLPLKFQVGFVEEIVANRLKVQICTKARWILMDVDGC